MSFGHCAAVLEEPPRWVRVHGVSFGACLSCVTACLSCVTEHIPKVYGTYTEGVEAGNGRCKMCYGAIHRRCIDQSEGCLNTLRFGAGIMPGRKYASRDPVSVGPKRPILPYFTTPLGVGMVGAKSAKNRHITQDTTHPNVQGGVLAHADGHAEWPR